MGAFSPLRPTNQGDSEMRHWLERLFLDQGLDCIVVLSWRDKPRIVSVVVDPGYKMRTLTKEFSIEIESLMWMSEEQLVEGYIKPVANTIKSAIVESIK